MPIIIRIDVQCKACAADRLILLSFLCAVHIRKMTVLLKNTHLWSIILTMENEENKMIFTFDPGEPPADLEREEALAAENEVVFDWTPSDEPFTDPEQELSEVFEDNETPEEKPAAPSEPQRRKPVTSMKKSNKNKYLIRRIIALALLCLIILIPVVKLISKAIQSKYVTTENVGPLPSDEVVVHRVPLYYDYTRPAPETAENEAFFENAIIIGDTRVVQLLPTYNIGTFSKVLYGTAINVSNALTYDCVDADGVEQTFASALTERSYGKVYICLGLNELGWSYPEVFEEDYDALIDEIKRLQPAASIFLLNIVPVDEAKYSNNYIKNSRIKEYNDMIMSVAQKHSAYCVDCCSGMSDASGSLNGSYSSNGFYINETGGQAWWKYLATHTVDPEDYEN